MKFVAKNCREGRFAKLKANLKTFSYTESTSVSKSKLRRRTNLRSFLFPVDLFLWGVAYLHAQPIQRIIARGVAGHHGQAHTEIGIVEVGVRPGASPGVGDTSEGIDGFIRGKGGG